MLTSSAAESVLNQNIYDENSWEYVDFIRDRISSKPEQIVRILGTMLTSAETESVLFNWKIYDYNTWDYVDFIRD